MRTQGKRAREKTAARDRPHRASTHRPAALSSGAWLILPLMAGYAAVLVWAVWTQKLPWWVLALSPVVNLLAFFAYWQDKYAAGRGGWRTPEDTLHFWSLAGGWGGAWFAQQVLRHKTSKLSFRQVYWFTVAAHCAGLGYWLHLHLPGG